MVNLRNRTLGAPMAVVAALGLAAPAQAAILSIRGGTPVDSIPQGTSGDFVLPQAGIGMSGGLIWIDGTLDILSDQVTLTLHDVGSESHWIDQIRLGNTSGWKLRDSDDHKNGVTVFTNGPLPGQLVGSVTQTGGVADFEFWQTYPYPDVRIVVNGQSPMMMVENYGYASIALAYLSDTYQIVSGPTNRVLVLLEDGSLTDRDYEDYVGILEASSTGPASGAEFVLSPATVAFGSQALNLVSSSQAITLDSTGGISLPITSIALSGANAGQFALSHNCGSSVPSGRSCLVTVTFKPTGTGSKTAAVAVTTGAGTKSVSLAGTGVRSVYSVAPTALAFGNRVRNTTSTAQTVQIRNTGTVVLPISSITLGGTNPGQFSRTHDCPAQVPVGGSCSARVQFKPTGTGLKSAALKVASGGGAAAKSVALSGTGT